MRYAILAAFVAFGTGCVPVTEPLSDIEKAEPDKNLIGDWALTDKGGDLRITVPEVKGNPKGLIRAGGNDDPKEAVWFYTTTIAKSTYANVILTKKGDLKQFDTVGEFAKWQKEPAKWFYLFRYTIDGDKLTIDAGSQKVVKQLMTDAKVAISKGTEFYETPAGWLAKYLDKNDPKAIFDGSNVAKYRKLKK